MGHLVIFKRFEGEQKDMPPLHWRKLTDEEREIVVLLPDKRPVAAVVTCKNNHGCKIRIGVHSLSPAGVLQPSLQCPVPGCDGHEDPGSTLEGWGN